MKSIFAPWRMEFIAGKREKGCVFCTRGGRRQDETDFILFRGKKSFVILNKYPYNSGHMMVVPYRHTAALEDLKGAETGEIFSLLQRCTEALNRACKPQGFNVGLNQGKAAGAGIDDHIHFHVIPRWFADTNFWPVIGETKTIPEHLKSTYLRLKKVWK